MPHTITVHYAQGILQAAERLGLPVPADLQAASLEPRIPLQRQDAFWEAICAASGDPLLGLRLGSALQVGHLDMVGALLMSCDHYGEALDALLEYYPIIAEGSEFQREQDATQVRLVYRPSYAVRREERVEAALASLVHLTRWITGDRVNPQRLILSHAARGEPTRYVEVLGCPVIFEGAENALSFAVADLDVPLIQANALMREHLRALADASSNVWERRAWPHACSSCCGRTRAGARRRSPSNWSSADATSTANWRRKAPASSCCANRCCMAWPNNCCASPRDWARWPSAWGSPTRALSPRLSAAGAG